MALVVRTNTTAGNALNQLNTTSRALERSFQRLSTGRRIGRAADDPAALSVAEGLRASAASAVVAARNANDGISIIAVADSATAAVGSILVRMRELAIQAASETLGTVERSHVDAEYDGMADEILRIGNSTVFNGRALAAGAWATDTIEVQVGTFGTAQDRIAITLGNLADRGTEVAAEDLTAVTGARAALDTFDAVITSVNGYRASFGAAENRLTSALTNLGQFEQTTTAAESRIRDADFGRETALLSRNRILQQAGVSVLAQAKSMNRAAVDLLF
jgi:flagellin